MSKGFASNYRIVLLAIGLLASFGGLGARLVWLHVINREELLRSITKAREKVIVEKARRGDILDRNGGILATSRPLIELGVDPWSVRPDDESKWPQLATLLGIPLEELEKKITTKYYPAAPAIPAPAASPAQPPGDLVINIKLGGDTSAAPGAEKKADASNVAPDDDDNDEQNASSQLDDNGRRRRQYTVLSRSVSESQYAQIEKLKVTGLVTNRVYRRAYPHGQLGAHVIGYVDKGEHPMTGIEHYADFYLRGQDGWRESEKDGHRRELAQFRSREVPRANGYNVVLSLDATVQDIVEQELAVIAQKFQPEKATIIVSDPNTGFILGMGNYPTFDLNEYGSVPKEALASMKNIAVTDVLEPGSTFKIVSVAAGLEEGIVTPNDHFNCSTEKVQYKGRILSLPKDDHHWDHELSVAEIVAHSSNRGAAQIGMKLGDQRLYNYARAFGFGRPLGFPTGGEVSGILKNPDVKTDAAGNETSQWNPLDITRIPMGHTIAATALQMHQAMSTIANRGVLLRPQIVQQIKDAAGESVYVFERREIGRAVSERVADTMAQMLMAVATKDGTAPEAAIPGFEVAGKTGTTQMIIDGKYSEKHHIGSFVGFFPASKPRVAITVVVHNADDRLPGGWGAKVAAPSFKKIGEQLIPYLSITAPKPSSVPAMLAYTGGRR